MFASAPGAPQPCRCSPPVSILLAAQGTRASPCPSLAGASQVAQRWSASSLGRASSPGHVSLSLPVTVIDRVPYWDWVCVLPCMELGAYDVCLGWGRCRERLPNAWSVRFALFLECWQVQDTTPPEKASRST